MIIDIAKHSRPGGHEINEDSLLCGNSIYVVADGLGGHSSGEEASAAAIEFIDNNYNGDFSDAAVSELLEGANTAVCNLKNGSHTTVAALFHDNNTVRFANVGDSRVYYFRHNKLFSMTKDHSVCQASVDMGEMTFDDIRTSSDRSRLLKVLGSESKLNLKRMYEPISAADGDAFLICSDGFWEHVYETEMEADLLKADTAEGWLRNMMKRQLLRAMDKDDNCSVICGIISSDKKAPPLVAPPIPAQASVDIPEKKQELPKKTPVKSKKKKMSANLRAALLILAVIAVFGTVVVLALSQIIQKVDPSLGDSDEDAIIIDEETGEDVTYETLETELPAIATILPSDTFSEDDPITESPATADQPYVTTTTADSTVTTMTISEAETTTTTKVTTTTSENNEEAEADNDASASATTSVSDEDDDDSEESKTITTTPIIVGPPVIIRTSVSTTEITTAPETDNTKVPEKTTTTTPEATTTTTSEETTTTTSEETTTTTPEETTTTITESATEATTVITADQLP